MAREVTVGVRAPGGGDEREPAREGAVLPHAAEPAAPARTRFVRRRPRGTTATKLALSITVVAALMTAAVTGTYAALSGTTENAGNSFTAGTVSLTDNDANGVMFNLVNQKPGVPTSSCIKVTYTGSLPADVKLYASAVTGSMAQYLTVTVTRGTDSSPSFNSCAGFSPDTTDYSGKGAGVLYSGTLQSFPAAYATAVSDPASGWPKDTSASYRFTVTVNDTDAVQGLTSTAAFTWEARNS